MKILIACEESQVVCIAFRNKGHEAYSCDIQECSGGHPEWHIRGDVLEQLDKGWDMMIAHPPCTYLSNAGAKHLFRHGKLNEQRYKAGLEAKEFFMRLLNANIQKICVENPISSKIFGLPEHSQYIQPFEHGHQTSKKTRLWLRGLPLLIPTNIVEPKENCYIAGAWFQKGGKDRQKHRSKTFPGIAQAMADQWG